MANNTTLSNQSPVNNETVKKQEVSIMNTTTTTTTNALVNIAVLQATKNADILKSVDGHIKSVETTAFKVAVKIGYLIGYKIPYNGGLVKNSKPMKQKDCLVAVNRSKATVSRWLKALRLIIDNGLFDDFNAGVYPFSFDKIIMILADDNIDYVLTDDETVDTATFAEVMAMATPDIEALYTDETETADETDETAETETADDNTVDFTVDGVTYRTNRTALLEFIANHCQLV